MFMPFFDYCVICDLQSGSALIGSITGVKASLNKTLTFSTPNTSVSVFPEWFPRYVFYVDSNKFYKNHGYILYFLNQVEYNI